MSLQQRYLHIILIILRFCAFSSYLRRPHLNYGFSTTGYWTFRSDGVCYTPSFNFLIM